MSEPEDAARIFVNPAANSPVWDHNESGYCTPETILRAVGRLAQDDVAYARILWGMGVPIPTPHICSEFCVCPIHEDLPLFYSRAEGEHACQRRDCIFTHGMKRQPYMLNLGGRRNGRNTLRQAIAREYIGLAGRTSEYVARHTAIIRAVRQMYPTIDWGAVGKEPAGDGWLDDYLKEMDVPSDGSHDEPADDDLMGDTDV